MSINVLSGLKSPVTKVYSLGLKDRAVIDQEFDKLHEQEKLKWTSKATKYGFLIFVI